MTALRHILAVFGIVFVLENACRVAVLYHVPNPWGFMFCILPLTVVYIVATKLME